MKIDQKNYVDEAERVMKSLVRTNAKGSTSMPLTTSKIRNLLSMVSELKTDAQHSRGAALDEDMQSRVQYLKMRIAYEAGREREVRELVERADLLTFVSEIRDDRKKLLLFCDYMEALTAYHRFYGGREN